MFLSYLVNKSVVIVISGSDEAVGGCVILLRVGRVLRGHSIAQVITVEAGPRLFFEQGDQLFAVITYVADLEFNDTNVKYLQFLKHICWQSNYKNHIAKISNDFWESKFDCLI